MIFYVFVLEENINFLKIIYDNILHTNLDLLDSKIHNQIENY